jgi:hypothetical protein
MQQFDATQTQVTFLRIRCDDTGAIDGMNASERSIRGDSRAFFYSRLRIYAVVGKSPER